MEPFQYKVHSGDKLFSFILLIGGDLFLLFCFVMITKDFSSSANTIVGLMFLVLFTALWNGYFLKDLANCPTNLELSDEGLTITWWHKNDTVKYPWNDVRLEKIGLNPTKVIKVKDSKRKKLRLVSMNGWDTRYGDLTDRIEHYIKQFSNQSIQPTRLSRGSL